jgi:threonine/homoserine/homoserine lactone efflux protein
MALVFPTRIWEYALAALVIILAPGPSVLFTIARAIAWGRATAVATVAGNVLGAVTLSLLVAVGLGPILQRSHLAFTTVQILGGSYLVYLGITAIKRSPIHALDMVQQGEIKPSHWRSARDGYWVAVLNPKSLVFFAAILPQFADRRKGHLTSQLISMGIIFAAIAFLCDSGWGILAGTIRNWLATEMKRLVRMRVTGGAVMIILGTFTIFSALWRT